MIITADDIRKYRPIAQNINATDRIDTYIVEVETLFLIPQLGAKLFKDIDTNKSNYSLLIDGGYYNNDESHFAGLLAAVSYLAYARFILNQPFNVTALGNVFKNSEFSEKADMATTARMSNQAEKIGLEYLRQCVEYLKSTGRLADSVKTIRKNKLTIIGG